MDATPVLCEKREAQRTCLGERGYMPMPGHIGETGQAAGCGFRDRNAALAEDNLGFIKTGAAVDGQSVCREVWAMADYEQAFTPVAQRTRRGGRQCLDLGEDGADDETAMTDGRYGNLYLFTN